MKHTLFPWCRTMCLLLFLCTSALQAQYSNEAAQAKKLSELYDQRGYMNGQSISVDGSLAVADANGIPSYTYPISSFTSNGHGINVTLNYAGSVSFSTYHRYYEFSQSSPNESWSKYHKTAPAWLLGVNGFAVQALAFASTFVNDPYYMTINWSDNNIEYTDKQFVWTIDGYDVCNRMAELVSTSNNPNRRDVIRLLRTDGSVLELHNITNTSDLPPSQYISFNPELYRGYYYENTANPSAYGRVEFDSTYIPPNTTIDPARIPRILRYYPGDGLEYVFREFGLPFGNETYHAYLTNGATGQAVYGAEKAPPTIFYLVQINDETENVLSFEYARHTPQEQMSLRPGAGDQEVSRGRALCTGFTGHTLIYNSNALSIQALGRTTNIRFATAAGGSAYRDTTALDATSDSPIIIYGEDGAPAPTLSSISSSGAHNCWTGYITSITDPEGRQTQFTYEKYTRIFRTIGFPHQFTANDQRPVKLAFWRMKNVTEPTVEQRISYHGATDTTITASGGFMNTQSASVGEKLALKYALNATVSDVKKYDLSNNLLTTRTFDIQHHATIPPVRDFHISNYRDGWFSHISQTDHATGHVTYNNYDYHVYEFPTHESGMSISFSQLYARESQADGEYTYTETHYRRLDSNMLIQPYKTFTKVKNGYGGTFLMQSAARYEYDTVTVRPYPDANSRQYLGQEIAQRRTYTLNPADTSKTLVITKSNYLHIAQLDTVFTARSRQWNKQKAFEEFQRMLPQLVQNGDSTMWAEVMASIMAYDTIETNTLRRMPALYNLETRSVVTDAMGTILSGAAKRYATSYKQDDTSSIYRGALLSDSLIGYGGVSMFQTAYTYWGGRTGYHRALLRTETDAAGAVTRYEYDYAPGTGGLMACNDNSIKSATLFGRRGIGEYESPLRTTEFKRAFALGGMPYTTALADAVERTYHDQVSASVDENGIYTRFDYDRNGRMRTAWLPKDFPGDSLYTELWTGELEVSMPGFTRYTHRVDTIICSPPPGTPPNEIYKISPLYVTPDYLRLIAAKLPDAYPCGGGGTISTPLVSGSENSKKESPLSTAAHPRPYDANRLKCGYFTAAASRPIREAVSLTEAKLRLHLTKILGNCVNFTVRIMRPTGAHAPDVRPTYSDTLLVQTYVLNCNGVWSAPQNGTALTDGSSKYETPKPLSGGSSSPLPYQLLTVNLNAIANDLISGPWEVEVSTTTMGGEVEIVNDGSDWQPTLILKGSFNRVHELADYSMRYDFADRWADPMEAMVWTKLDDSLHTANKIGPGTTPVDNSRYTLVKNRFGADYRILAGLETKTKSGMTWTDSVLTQYTGTGQTRRVTDQLGDTMTTVYDAQGRTRFIYNADGTVRENRYAFGVPSSMTSSDQDFYGFCRRVLSIEEDGQVSAQFYDAFGRLRLQSVIYAPHDTNTLYAFGYPTKYEYDLLGRLTTVVNPGGDTSRVWYDAFGRIRYRYQPDMGYTSYTYDKLGNLRFMQTQAQADSALITFQEYDDLGRKTLVGEARLGGEPGGGGHSMMSPGGKKEGVLGFPPHPSINLNRLTDQLDPNILHDDNTSGILTANKTIQFGWLVPLPSFWTMNELEQTMCSPVPKLPDQPLGQLLRHPVAYYNDSGLPLSTATDFEHISRYPQNARTVIHYDELPQSGGSVWFYFPTSPAWDALAPTGRVRHQKGREAAVAYRTHAGEPYHYTVMSYDERGRVEAVLHYTENLGFDAVYYTYNSLNLPVCVRVVDPQRQHAAWYGYNSNGRTDSVWTLLTAVGSGLGVSNPSYPQPPAKPTYPDMVYDYTKRWQTATMAYPLANTVVSYNYNARRFLDSMIVLKNGSTRLFTQKLKYDVTGQITRQTTRHNTQGSDQIQEYDYDFQGQLVKWARDTVVWGPTGEVFYYDDNGNRQYKTDRDVAGWPHWDYLYSAPTTGSKNRLLKVAGRYTSDLDTMKFQYTSDGSVRYRERRIGNGLKQENFTYENIQGRTKRYTRWDGSVGGFGMSQDWHYRYNAAGAREQKRLYQTAYSKTWNYYLLGGDGKQLAVYKGIESSMSTCGSGATNVYMFPAEYLTYANDEIHHITTRPLDDVNGIKEYKVQDHLGNTRVVIQGGSVTGQFDYRPFGGILWQNGTAPRLTWIDREEDAESSLGEFGARKYDEELGRFMSVDPRLDEQPSLSPYHYAANNPVSNKDADGEIFDTILDVAFIAADVIDIGVSIAQGKGVSTEQVVSLTANVVCLAIPGATGGGAVARAVMKADKVVDAVKTGVKAEKALVNTGKTIKAVDKTADVSKTVKATNSTAKKTHGNKLDNKPAEGYTLRDRKTGAVKKYGETTRGEDKYGAGKQKRYSKKELKEKDVYYQKEVSGTKKDMHTWQHQKIKDHKAKNNGNRPDLNKSDY